MIRAKIEEYKVTKDSKVLEKLKAAANEICALSRDDDGLFTADGISQEDLLRDVMPVYTLFETKLNKKENYIDLVEQCKAAVKKYPGSKKVFVMLAEVLECFSEEIYEHYKTIQALLREQYMSVSANMDEDVAYALAKACFYKAFLLEKYEDVLMPYATEQYPTAYDAIKRLEKRFERN